MCASWGRQDGQRITDDERRAAAHLRRQEAAGPAAVVSDGGAQIFSDTDGVEEDGEVTGQLQLQQATATATPGALGNALASHHPGICLSERGCPQLAASLVQAARVMPNPTHVVAGARAMTTSTQTLACSGSSVAMTPVASARSAVGRIVCADGIARVIVRASFYACGCAQLLKPVKWDSHSCPSLCTAPRRSVLTLRVCVTRPHQRGSMCGRVTDHRTAAAV